MKYIVLCIGVFFAFAKAHSQEISPQTAVVDVQKIEAHLQLDFEDTSVAGDITVNFLMKEAAKEIFLDAHSVELSNISNNKKIKIKATEDKVVFTGDFKKGTTYQVSFSYKVYPKQTAYFVNNQGKNQFWTQGQGKYTSHWLPSLDDMNDKIEFDITIDHSSQMLAVSNGVGKRVDKDNGITTSSFDMEHPIPSYLVALVVGAYETKEEVAASGVPLTYYYYPEDAQRVEATYRYSKQIFDFLESKIGVPFPFKTYKQVPVKDFLYAGMENASCTVFSDQFVVDEIGFTDQNYVNVNAHELAHQWFGDLVTETKSDHHWLHEGFATYYALLAEREIFGGDYFYFKLFETAEQLRELSDKGKGQRLVAAGGSSLTYYQKGAWAIHILRETVGEEAFDKAVQSYLTKYAYKNVTTDNFMDEVARFTSVDLTEFSKNWLYQGAFQAEDAVNSLKKSEFMQEYFQIQSGRSVALSSKFVQLMKAIETGNDYLGQEAIYQLSEESISGVLPAYKKAMATKNVYIRQAIATSLEAVPEELSLDFYDLLNDKSYLTQEQVLIKLWVYYQQRNDVKSQRSLLDLMENTFGFADGNVKTLWLTLSLATPDYKPEASLARYKELIGYTAPKYPYQLRQNAFRYLEQLQSFEKESLKNLVEASVHHVWRFRESARKQLDRQLKNTEYVSTIRGMESVFSEKEMGYLKRIEVF